MRFDYRRRNPITSSGKCYECKGTWATGGHKKWCIDRDLLFPEQVQVAPVAVPPPPGRRPPLTDAQKQVLKELAQNTGSQDPYQFDGEVYCSDCADGIKEDMENDGTAPEIKCQESHCRFRGKEGYGKDEFQPLHAGWFECPQCGSRRASRDDDGDSSQYPQSHDVNGTCVSDSPEHCGSHKSCVNAIVMPDGDKIGAWLGNELTEEGCKYVCEAADGISDVGELWKEWYRNDCECLQEKEEDEERCETCGCTDDDFDHCTDGDCECHAEEPI